MCQEGSSYNTDSAATAVNSPTKERGQKSRPVHVLACVPNNCATSATAMSLDLDQQSL